MIARRSFVCTTILETVKNNFLSHVAIDSIVVKNIFHVTATAATTMTAIWNELRNHILRRVGSNDEGNDIRQSSPGPHMKTPEHRHSEPTYVPVLQFIHRRSPAITLFVRAAATTTTTKSRQ